MSKGKKIGLLVINGPLPPPYGGVATYLAHTLPFLAARGYEVHTLIDKRPSNPKQYATFERAGIHIHYSDSSRLKKVLQLLKRFRVWISICLNSGVSFLSFLGALKSIAGWIGTSERVIREYPIDIIHAYDYPWVQGVVAAHLTKKYKKKYVQTIFGEVVPHKGELVHHDNYGDRFKELVRYVLCQSDLLVSVSKHCAREVGYVGINPEEVKVTYYGIDITRFSPDVNPHPVRMQHQLDGKHVVLFLGQVRLRKGPQVLLEAAPIILQRVPDTVFLIVGPDYGNAADLRKRAEQLRISSKFVLLGPKPDEMLPSLFAACDVFVFPSCTTIECLGLSMVQAMACGKPVVGSNIDGIPEVIIDGLTGFLVEPNNAEQLAEKVFTLLENVSLQQRMGAAARQRAVENFDRERLVSQLKDLYGELMARPS